jgi:hypothetical protein
MKDVIVKGTLNTVKGDVTSPQMERGVALICHVCNDLGVMGAGVALAISKKFPKVKEHYVHKINMFEENIMALGETDVCNHSVTGNTNIWVANMIAQHNIYPNEKKPIRYEALIRCMGYIASVVEYYNDDIENTINGEMEIHCPKFGSLRSGGTWEFILELIEEMWINKGINVTVYEYD